MNENENNIRLQFTNGEYELTRDKSELFKYIGHLAVFNHVFVELSRDDESRKGIFLPEQTIGAESFDKLSRLMLQRGYVAHLNLREVDDYDVDAITKLMSKDMGDTIPDDWV